MTRYAVMSHPAIRLTLWSALGVLAASPAWALYKVTGADGKVSYTDRPPVAVSAKGQPTAVKSLDNAGNSLTAGLPYALAQLANRYPVTLYAFQACGACDQGRQYLKQRGIPFIEKSVNTDADMKAFEAFSGMRQMPLLTIGRQQIKGYSAEEWGSYLDVAGYPASSQLPRTYQWPAPKPMVSPSALTDSPSTGSERNNEPKTQQRPTPAKPSGNATPGFRF